MEYQIALVIAWAALLYKALRSLREEWGRGQQAGNGRGKEGTRGRGTGEKPRCEMPDCEHCPFPPCEESEARK